MASRRVGGEELEVELEPSVPPLLLGLEAKGRFRRLLFSVELLVPSPRPWSGPAKGVRGGGGIAGVACSQQSDVHVPLAIDDAGGLGWLVGVLLPLR